MLWSWRGSRIMRDTMLIQQYCNQYYDRSAALTLPLFPGPTITCNNVILVSKVGAFKQLYWFMPDQSHLTSGPLTAVCHELTKAPVSLLRHASPRHSHSPWPPSQFPERNGRKFVQSSLIRSFSPEIGFRQRRVIAPVLPKVPSNGFKLGASVMVI